MEDYESNYNWLEIESTIHIYVLWQWRRNLQLVILQHNLLIPNSWQRGKFEYYACTELLLIIYPFSQWKCWTVSKILLFSSSILPRLKRNFNSLLVAVAGSVLVEECALKLAQRCLLYLLDIWLIDFIKSTTPFIITPPLKFDSISTCTPLPCQ